MKQCMMHAMQAAAAAAWLDGVGAVANRLSQTAA
jgi:hypothetical protein